MGIPTRPAERRRTRLAPSFPGQALSVVAIALTLIFIVVAQLVRTRVEPALASSPVAKAGGGGAYRFLVVDVADVYWLDQRRMTWEGVEQAIRTIGAASPQPVVRVRAAGGLPYLSVQRVIDALHASGVSRVEVEVQVGPVVPSRVPGPAVPAPSGPGAPAAVPDSSASGAASPAEP